MICKGQVDIVDEFAKRSLWLLLIEQWEQDKSFSEEFEIGKTNWEINNLK